MAQTMSETHAQRGATEPERSGATIAGGYLVAEALKAEGVDVTFTLCDENYLMKRSTPLGEIVRQPKSPGHWMDPVPPGALDVGIPFVLGTKSARPDKEVVALFGDGAFSLTGWDFETLVRYNRPFVGIVGNNSSMNQIGYGQQAKYGADRGRVGNSLGDVRYDEFARMLGGYGEEVGNPQDIAPALQRARESGKPSLINVWGDPDALAPGTMNQTMYK